MITTRICLGNTTQMFSYSPIDSVDALAKEGVHPLPSSLCREDGDIAQNSLRRCDRKQPWSIITFAFAILRSVTGRCQPSELQLLPIRREMDCFSRENTRNIPTLLHRKWNDLRRNISISLSNNIVPSLVNLPVEFINWIPWTSWSRLGMCANDWIKSLRHLILTRSSS